MDSGNLPNYEPETNPEERKETSLFDTSWNVRSRRLIISGESGIVSNRRRRALSAPTVVGRDRRRRGEDRSEWSYCKHGKLKQRFLSQKNENNSSFSFSRQQSNGNSTIVPSDFPDCGTGYCPDADSQSIITTQPDHQVACGQEPIPIPTSSTSPCSLGGVSCSPRSLTSEEGISRTVERMLRISQEVETEYHQDFTLLARKLTDSWLAQDHRGVPTDFPSFCRKMDQILDTPSVQRSLSSQTPFRRILFIWLVNVLYTRELDYASQLVRRLWGFALRYINSIFFSLNLIRKSSSMLSFCCGSSSNPDEVSRSRLSSMGNQSILSNEESSLYSSTFDLDLTTSPSPPTVSSGSRNSYSSPPANAQSTPISSRDSGNPNATMSIGPTLSNGSRTTGDQSGSNEGVLRVGSCPNSSTVSSKLDNSTSSSVDESPNRRVRKCGVGLWKSESFSTSVDAVEYDSAMASANDLLKSAQNDQCHLTSSSGVVRRKTKSERKKCENGQKSTNGTHEPLRRRESDVDSAVFVDNDVTHESLNSVNFGIQQQQQQNQQRTSGSAQVRQRSESASVSSVDDIREEHRQAAIRKRRALIGLRGRLPSFSEDMSQLSAYLNELSPSSDNTQSNMIDDSIRLNTSNNSQMSGTRNQFSTDFNTHNDGFNKSFYTTFTLCILAAIFISKK